MRPGTIARKNVDALRAGAIIFAFVGLSACEGEPLGGPATEQPEVWQNTTPKIRMVSPGELAVGEELLILGEDFIPSERGSTLLTLRGTYFDDEGGSFPVQLLDVVKPSQAQSGALAWRLWPNIRFHPTGDRLGYFLGEATLINKSNQGDQLVSEPMLVKIQIKPSLIPRLVRPSRSQCQSLVTSTVEKTPFVLSVEAVGLRAASPERPLTFSFAFRAEHWDVVTQSQTYPNTGAIRLDVAVTDGRIGTLEDGGGTSLVGDGQLKELRTRAVPEEGNSFDTTINVSVADGSGKTVALGIPLTVARVAGVLYDGSMLIAEREAPVRVSDCIPGGDIGRQVNYSEDTHESRRRTMGFNYNVSLGVSLGLPAVADKLGINFSVGFGMDVDATVVSGQSMGVSVGGRIMPGQYGVFYRQTTRVVRVGRLVAHDKCGGTTDLGQAILTDWLFTPELATGSVCAPPSKLPPAQRFL